MGGYFTLHLTLQNKSAENFKAKPCNKIIKPVKLTVQDNCYNEKLTHKTWILLLFFNHQESLEIHDP